MQDVAHQSALDVIDPAKVQAERADPLPPGACDQRVIVTAVLTESIAKFFHDIGRRASAVGFNIKIGRSWQDSTESFDRDLYVYVETRAM